MTKKSESALQLIERIQLRWPLPDTPPQAETLLEKGMVLVLLREITRGQAEALVTAFRASYEDWNEVRVCQTQELMANVRAHRKGPSISDDALRRAVLLARDYLQEIFQRTHGLDLSEFNEDPAAAGKLLPLMPLLGMATGSYLLWIATGGQLVVHPALIRVLDRIGLVQRSGSSRKGRELVEPVVPEGKLLEFLLAFSEVADRWCDARKPVCHECVLVDDCRYGKKAFKEYQVQRARMEAQRKRDEARRAVLEKKESARRAREDARAHKRAAADAAKQARELERKRKVEERQAERTKLEAEKRAKADRKAAAAKKLAGKAGASSRSGSKPAKKSEPRKSGSLVPKKRPETAAKKPTKPPRKPARR